MKKNILMRTTAATMSLFLVGSLFVGCKATTPVVEPSATVAAPTIAPVQDITFWHFNKDEGTALAAGFNKKQKDVNVKVEIIPDTNGSYQTKITSLINAGGTGMPDVFAAESAYVKRFDNLENGYMDITADAQALTGDMYTYTVDIGKDKTGAIRALSHQACPGGLGYKRDLTKKYFGTDDPAAVAALMSSTDKMIETGKKIAGKAKLFAGQDDIWNFFNGSRTSPWVKDGKLVIDPKVTEFLTFAKQIRDLKLDSGIAAWSPGWDTAIKDTSTIFFAIPTWGVPWIIGAKEKPEVKDTGRWAITASPFPYAWGGTWFGIYAKTTKKDSSFKFIKYLTADKDDTKERVKASGDFSNMKSVNTELASDASMVSKVINQNPFAIWEPLAGTINGSLFTEYDDQIKTEFLNLAAQFTAGKIKTSDEVITQFKAKMKTTLKDANITIE
jgi:multiple sugar transport system substrate-binding protein